MYHVVSQAPATPPALCSFLPTGPPPTTSLHHTGPSQARPLLELPPKFQTAEADIALIFQQAALKSTADSDPLFANVSLRWLDNHAASASAPVWHPSRCQGVMLPKLDSWDGLFLEATIDWPLQLLFPPEASAACGLCTCSPCHTPCKLSCWAATCVPGTLLRLVGLCAHCGLRSLLLPQVLSKYGALWQYCLRLKRVQLALEEAWATLQALRHRRPEDEDVEGVGVGAVGVGPAGEARRLPPSLVAQLWQLRQRCAHFVGNLQLYVQMDVVDSSFARLRAAIEAARDFNEADALHQTYVKSLLSQAFLDVPQLAGLLQDIFAVCLRLVGVVRVRRRKGWSSGGGSTCPPGACQPACLASTHKPHHAGLLCAQDLGQGKRDIATLSATLRQLNRDFSVKLEMLFISLQSNKAQSNQRSPLMRQLVARLDFPGSQLAYLKR